MKIKHLGRNVGELKNNGVFVTYRGKEHIMRKFSSVGISSKVLLRLHRGGCSQIILLVENDVGGTDKLVSTPAVFLEHGFCITDKLNDHQRHIKICDLKNPPLTTWVKK